MINENEIKYNCHGLVSTWFEKHGDEINDTADVSLNFNGKKITTNNPKEIGDKLVEFILSGNKGAVDFIINGEIKEEFDIN